MQLIQAAKEGARLYSSGRIEIPQVKRLVQRALLRGSPPLRVPLQDIRVGSSRDSQEKFMQLDKVIIRYKPKQIWLKVLRSTMEESCVIKHAPPYGYPGVLGYGPPVRWGKIHT